jgi:hypothetical protein
MVTCMERSWPKYASRVVLGFCKVSPEAFHLNKPISSGKCEHKLAYNVSGAIQYSETGCRYAFV